MTPRPPSPTATALRAKRAKAAAEHLAAQQARDAWLADNAAPAGTITCDTCNHVHTPNLGAIITAARAATARLDELAIAQIDTAERRRACIVILHAHGYSDAALGYQLHPIIPVSRQAIRQARTNYHKELGT